MIGSKIRKGIFAASVLICVGCWAYTFGTLLIFGHPGVARWTTMVTISAVSTEAVFWVGAVTLGLSIFERRRKLLKRLGFGRKETD